MTENRHMRTWTEKKEFLQKACVRFGITEHFPNLVRSRRAV